MRIVRTFAEARRLARGVTALVPTMGFLHEGHLALLSRGRQLGDTLVMSLFVNPLQFEDPADLVRYPRDPGRDADLAREAGVDLLFAPTVEEMYPVEPATRVRVARLPDRMEGAHRRGHFDGVATVVTKLFAGLRPDLAVFGRKDAQQLAIVRRMATDLSFPVEVIECPIVRELDGLALSSRNVLIDDRDRALALSRGLLAAADAAEAGTVMASALAAVVISAAPEIDFDYVELADRDEMVPVEEVDRPAVLAAAAWVGPVRLIDNVGLGVAGDRVTADRGTWLTRESLLYGRVAP